jgi:hypothetical protein
MPWCIQAYEPILLTYKSHIPWGTQASEPMLLTYKIVVGKIVSKATRERRVTQEVATDGGYMIQHKLSVREDREEDSQSHTYPS